MPAPSTKSLTPSSGSIAAKPPRWVLSGPTPWGCTIWQAMWRNGAAIGKAPTLRRPRPTRRGLLPAPTVFYAAGRGTASRKIAGLPIATASHPTIATATSASASPGRPKPLPTLGRASLLPFYPLRSALCLTCWCTGRLVNVLLHRRAYIYAPIYSVYIYAKRLCVTIFRIYRKTGAYIYRK